MAPSVGARAATCVAHSSGVWPRRGPACSRSARWHMRPYRASAPARARRATTTAQLTSTAITTASTADAAIGRRGHPRCGPPPGDGGTGPRPTVGVALGCAAGVGVLVGGDDGVGVLVGGDDGVRAAPAGALGVAAAVPACEDGCAVLDVRVGITALAWKGVGKFGVGSKVIQPRPAIHSSGQACAS